MTPEYTSIPVCHADTPVRANARLVKGVPASCGRYCAVLLTTLVTAGGGVTDKQKHVLLGLKVDTAVLCEQLAFLRIGVKLNYA